MPIAIDWCSYRQTACRIDLIISAIQTFLFSEYEYDLQKAVLFANFASTFLFEMFL